MLPWLKGPVTGFAVWLFELYYSFTPTANAESWAVEAFSLCMFLSSTKLSEWSPMERRAPAQGSSRDQRI